MLQPPDCIINHEDKGRVCSVSTSFLVLEIFESAVEVCQFSCELFLTGPSARGLVEALYGVDYESDTGREIPNRDTNWNGYPRSSVANTREPESGMIASEWHTSDKLLSRPVQSTTK